MPTKNEASLWTHLQLIEGHEDGKAGQVVATAACRGEVPFFEAAALCGPAPTAIAGLPEGTKEPHVRLRFLEGGKRVVLKVKKDVATGSTFSDARAEKNKLNVDGHGISGSTDRLNPLRLT